MLHSKRGSLGYKNGTATVFCLRSEACNIYVYNRNVRAEERKYHCACSPKFRQLPAERSFPMTHYTAICTHDDTKYAQCILDASDWS